MSTEVDNLITPYLSVCIIKAHFSGGVVAQGSGVIISGDDVLTASHVIYNSATGEFASQIEIIPGYDGSTGGSIEEPLGEFAGYHAAFFTTFDPNGDGLISSGDNISSTLSGSELDVAVIHSNANNGVLAAFQDPFYLGTNFTSGSLRITGYPASAGGNPLEETLAMTKNGVDNSFFTPVTLGPGSSGGPVWNYLNGLPTVFGVVSTTSSVASIQSHLNWIQSYARIDNLFNVGTTANDIYRPYVPEFSIGKPVGFDTAYTFLPAGVEGATNLWGNFDGGLGVDTVALPWHSVTSAFNNAALGTVMTNWSVTAFKDGLGNITGSFQIGSSAISFSNVERVAFSDVIYDLTTLGIGQQFGVGPLLSETIVTGLDTGSPNPVQLGIASIAGDVADDFLVGGDNIDEMTGFDGDDVLLGGGGGDTIDGGIGDDTLEGQQGNDTILGGAGDDFVSGGGGADTLDGGDDFDTLSYAGSGSGVNINLGTGAVKGGHAKGDVILNFEDILGSNKSDTLTGDNAVNYVSGSQGDDFIRGAGGADVLIGGGGIDTLSYAGSLTGITINLATGIGVGGDAEGDQVSLFENVLGSNLADNITGNLLGNVLSGAGGNDTLTGGGGIDRLIGGNGADNLNGGGGLDTFVLSVLASSHDTILSFSVADDTLEINATEFGGGLVAGNPLLAGQLVINVTGLAVDADDRFILNSLTGDLFYDINGDDTGGAHVIVGFTGGIPILTVDDFNIV